MKKGPHLVVYDETNSERITAIEFGAVMENESSREHEVWVWNKKDFDDAPDAVDVRVSVVSGNSSAVPIIQSQNLQMRSDGILDPDGAGIVDDAETEFSPIGGDITEVFHRIGDIPCNCARRLIFRIDLQSGTPHQGLPILIIQLAFQSAPSKWLYAPE